MFGTTENSFVHLMRHRSHHFTFPREFYKADLQNNYNNKADKNRKINHVIAALIAHRFWVMMHFCMFVPWVLKQQTIIRLLSPSSNPSALQIYSFASPKQQRKNLNHSLYDWRPFQKYTRRHGKIMSHSSFQQFHIILIFFFIFIGRCSTFRYNTSADLDPVCSAKGFNGESWGFSLCCYSLQGHGLEFYPF